MMAPTRQRIARARAGALAFCAALMLSGCAAPPAPQVLTRDVVEHVTLPAGLLTCEGDPVLGPWVMQSQVADYIVRLQEAYADCSDDVAAIAQIENAPAGK